MITRCIEEDRVSGAERITQTSEGTHVRRGLAADGGGVKLQLVQRNQRLFAARFINIKQEFKVISAVEA